MTLEIVGIGPAEVHTRRSEIAWPYSITKPRRMACDTASVRLEAPSFAKMDATWVLRLLGDVETVRDQLVA